MAKWLKNNSETNAIYQGKTFSPGEWTQIPSNLEGEYKTDDVLLADLSLKMTLISSDGQSVYGSTGSEAIDFLKGGSVPNPKTSDNRDIIAINRIPPGYTVYPVGKADARQTSGYRAGDDMIFDATTKTRRFMMNSPWYGIGGRVIWEGADLSDYMSAYLKAPATVGVNSAGDFNKYNLGGSLNMYVPAAPGAGAWSLSLNEKYTGTNVLKCVPVPVAGNTGFFDFDIEGESITLNASQTGGYNLYDFEATLFCFASHCWGRKQDGAESSLEIPDVVGKLIPSEWVVDFTITTSKTEGIKAGLIMIAAIKGNV